jgi:hypothetical protein
MAAGPIIVHSLEHARAALAAAAELRVAVTLDSAPAAAGYGGPAWFGEIVAAVAAEFPAVAVTATLDCGEAPGDVMAAVRWASAPGRPKLMLRFTGDDETAARLADIAGQAGLTLCRDRPAGLDLRAARDPVAACRTWLRGV